MQHTAKNSWMHIAKANSVYNVIKQVGSSRLLHALEVMIYNAVTQLLSFSLQYSVFSLYCYKKQSYIQFQFH